MFEIDYLSKIFGNDAILETKGKKHVIVRSKDRNASQEYLEKYFRDKKVKFKLVEGGSHSSREIMKVEDFAGFIIFKPPKGVAGGGGGIDFEKQLITDLDRFYKGETDLRHPDVVDELIKTLKWNINDFGRFEVLHEGSKNQKRKIQFSGRDNFSITNSEGQYISDVTVKTDKGIFYLSLKIGSSFYIANSGVTSLFKTEQILPRICEFFGLDGEKMGGFGKEYACKTGRINLARVRTNLEDVISQAYGKKVIFVHKKGPGTVSVIDIGNSLGVSINSLTPASYNYPIPGKRKNVYINFDAGIGSKDYQVKIQIGGDGHGNDAPKMMRIWLKPK